MDQGHLGNSYGMLVGLIYCFIHMEVKDKGHYLTIKSHFDESKLGFTSFE